MLRSFIRLSRAEQRAVRRFLDIIVTWQSETTFSLVTAAPLLRAWAALPVDLRRAWTASHATVRRAHRADDMARATRVGADWRLPAYDVAGFGLLAVARLHARLRGKTAVMVRGRDVERYDAAIAVTPIAAYVIENDGIAASVSAMEKEIIVVRPVFATLRAIPHRVKVAVQGRARQVNMAKRYSGSVVVDVIYAPVPGRRGSDYKATISVDGQRAYSVMVGAPAAGFGRGVAYDSPEAYDEIANTALGFAVNDRAEVRDGTSVEDAADSDPNGTGFAISRKPIAKRNPSHAAVRVGPDHPAFRRR